MATSDHRFGADETAIISRKALSLIPALPRIVRSGDKFTAGALLLFDDESASGSVKVTASVSGGSSIMLRSQEVAAML